MENVLEKVLNITGLIPVKYTDLNDEQKNSIVHIHTEYLETFSDEEFKRVLDNLELKELIKNGFNAIIANGLIYRKRLDFIEVSETLETNGKNVTFIKVDTGQPYEKYGFEIIKHFLHLRICKI